MKKLSFLIGSLIFAFLCASGNAMAYSYDVTNSWLNVNMKNSPGWPNEQAVVEETVGDTSPVSLYSVGKLDVGENKTEGHGDWFTITLESSKSGTWMLNSSAPSNLQGSTWYLVVKAGTYVNIYEFTIQSGNGTVAWVTPQGKDVSHIEVYSTTSHVPIPAAAWLLGSGLLGLVGVRRWRKRG